MLADIESFLVRRLVCHLSTRGYNRLFIELLKTLKPQDGKPSERVRKFLMSSDAESTRWPNDKEFEKTWLINPLFRILTQKRIRMLLEAIERELRTGKTEKVPFDEKLTIEHLMPQDWRKHWPLPDGRPAADAEQLREGVLHTMGNLTLVTKKLNPAISNGPWDKKRLEILQHSISRLNHQLGTYSDWNEGAIVHRALTLFGIARKIWPHPEPDGLKA